MRKRASARFLFFFERNFRRAVKTEKHRDKRRPAPRNHGVLPGGEQIVVDRVKSLAEPVCAAEGLELVYVEFQREPGGRILRLYIDKPDGVQLTDCVGVSRQMGDILDVNMGDIGPYNLEVTSPGIDRPLAKAQDFERFKGNRARIRTNRPVAGQKNFTGVLLGISEGRVNLQMTEQTIAIPLEDIAKARLAQ